MQRSTEQAAEFAWHILRTTRVQWLRDSSNVKKNQLLLFYLACFILANRVSMKLLACLFQYKLLKLRLDLLMKFGYVLWISIPTYITCLYRWLNLESVVVIDMLISEIILSLPAYTLNCWKSMDDGGWIECYGRAWAIRVVKEPCWM